KERLQGLGVENTKVEPLDGKKDRGEQPIEGATLEKLVDALAKLEDLARAVERRGVSMGEYLAAEKDGKYPLAVWRDAKVAVKSAADAFVRSEEGLARRLAEMKQALGRDPKVFEEGDDPKERDGADVVVAKIYEHGEI